MWVGSVRVFTMNLITDPTRYFPVKINPNLPDFFKKPDPTHTMQVGLVNFCRLSCIIPSPRYDKAYIKSP